MYSYSSIFILSYKAMMCASAVVKLQEMRGQQMKWKMVLLQLFSTCHKRKTHSSHFPQPVYNRSLSDIT